MPELLITEADGSTRVIALEAGPLLMGRDPNCEIPFPNDAELSRRHLVVEKDGDNWWVRDLGSTNGTRINGNPLNAKYLLKVGDTISASKVSLLFRDKLAQSQAQSPRTVVFDAGKFEAISSGTISVHLHEVLESQDVRPQGFVPGVAKQWGSPLQALIRESRLLHGADGPWLFGEFSAADAMLAPVAWRFTTYDVPHDDIVGAWLSTVLECEAMRAWANDARTETEIIAADEAGIPV